VPNHNFATNDISFGAHILPRDPLASWPEQEQRNREMLSHAINLRDTIVFSGAGCSIPLGCPSWAELSEKAIPIAEGVVASKQLDRELKQRSMSQLNNLKSRKPPKPNPQDAAAPRQATFTPSSSDLTYVLGACERICRRCGCAKDFRKSLAELFADPQEAIHNPYIALLDLPVHRFVTSNYDCALESALGFTTNDDCDKSFPFGKNSFTQMPKYDEQLAIFSIAFAEDYEQRKVFHCHGWHRDPDSMILTEDDYEEWYLRDQAIGGRYRQTVDLIFNSNPILFVGFSLSDDDLLVPLRFLSAVDREGKYARPLFALLERSDVSNENRFEQLFDRYGIHVVAYDAPLKTTEGRAEALCNAIHDVAECCRTHRRMWLEKPSFRAVVSKSKMFLHCDPILDPFQHQVDADSQDSLISPALDKARLIWLVGPGGTGKSWRAIRLLRSLQNANQGEFQGFFSWSFRYSNDALSGFESALRFMTKTDDPGPAETLLDRFVTELRTQRYVVVLDGVERFLHQNLEKGTVIAANSSYRRFFSALREGGLKSVLVLTSRLLPSKFEASRTSEIREDIIIEKTAGWDRGQISSILKGKCVPDPNGCVTASLLSWFRGHQYGVTLAACWLEN
jgi:SIR2-like domain